MEGGAPETRAAAGVSPAPPVWQFWIDRGGTFTDCIGVSPEGELHVAKRLSSDAAPLEAIREILGAWDPERARDWASLPMRVQLGTTVATNALLERKGVPTALVTVNGLSGVFDIGTQERPELFELEIQRPRPLASWSRELSGRVDAKGERVVPLDLDEAAKTFRALREEGAESVAIAGMHAYLAPEDEAAWAECARDAGFEHVVMSSQMAREIGFLARGETAIADAYLTPLLHAHLEALRADLPAADFAFMQSSGGLTSLERFRGPNALLSGPAGGVVATAHVAAEAGFARAIGFDMGGTSTDVSLVRPDALDRVFESVVGGVRVKAPTLSIHTVAAGGGSICRFDGIGLTVGPESAGSDPGPLCYAQRGSDGQPKARELTVTDINLALGRIAPDRFPFELDEAPVRLALDAMTGRLAEAGFERSALELAEGFFEIANASMAQAIAEVSVARGADPREHVLVGFGGAGGQHVCAIARRLGIREILLHPYAGLLSAYGIGLAESSWDGQRDGLGRDLSEVFETESSVEADWLALEAEARASLREAGTSSDALLLTRSLDLGYSGSDTAIPVSVRAADSAARAAGGAQRAGWLDAFAAVYEERFGYLHHDRAIEVKAVRVHAVRPEPRRTSFRMPGTGVGTGGEVDRGISLAKPLRTSEAWFPGIGWTAAPVYAREALTPGARLAGPALILEGTGTVVLDPGFDLEVDGEGVFRLSMQEQTAGTSELLSKESRRSRRELEEEADPVRLEVLGNRFMSIAEQMGAVLRKTAMSVNIKERLDYSCAVFDHHGGLVANAPHIPVHLGAMADTVAALRARFEPFAPGDVVVTNDPFEGGSHLPDVTVVTPVFLSSDPGKDSCPSPGQETPSFYVASRGHHADIGGAVPGSMPPHSEQLAEEGILIEPFHLVRAGIFETGRIRAMLEAGDHPARRPEDNVADLEAKVAANRAGAELLRALVHEVGEETVQITMGQLQRAAAAKVSRELARWPAGRHTFSDQLDDGTPIEVALEVEHTGPEAARMRVDFEGSGPASTGNLNAPVAVVRAAVLYVLRSLVEERIPLNGGCLDPVDLRIPKDSILDPPRGAAVVGGNVETSQRVVDVLLGALGRAAASQGTMNNVTFGNASFGYYETIGGGAGASARAAGASGVHTHMTNTRITDPEVLEARFPVRLVAFELRRGSGGAGAMTGGDGIRRAYQFLEPVTVSLLTERRRAAPFGLEGGGEGARGRNRLRRRGQAGFEDLPGRAEIHFQAGDELWIETPGGGGFGPSRKDLRP